MKTMKNKKTVIALVLLGVLTASAVPPAISAASAEDANVSSAGQIAPDAGYWCPGVSGGGAGWGGCYGYRGGQGYDSGSNASDSGSSVNTPQSVQF